MSTLLISVYSFGQEKETYDTLLWGSEYGPLTIKQNNVRRMKIIEKRNESVNCPTCNDHEVKMRYVKRKTSYKFDNNGFPINFCTRGRFVRNISGKITNVYSQTGQLLRSDCYTNSLFSKPYHRWVLLKYDSMTRLSEMQWYYSDSVIWCKRVYVYDASGRIVEDQFYQPKISTPEIPTKNIKYVYDTLGQLITRYEVKVTHVSSSISTTRSTINYHYSENRKLLGKDFYVDQVLVNRVFLTYDSITSKVIIADTISGKQKKVGGARAVTVCQYGLPANCLQWQLTVTFSSVATSFSQVKYENYSLIKTKIEILSSQVFPFTTVPGILDSQLKQTEKQLPWEKKYYYKTSNYR